MAVLKITSHAVNENDKNKKKVMQKSLYSFLFFDRIPVKFALISTENIRAYLYYYSNIICNDYQNYF